MDITLCWCFLYASKMGSELEVDIELLLIYIYIYIYICCAFVGLDYKLYKMYGTYIKIVGFIYFRK